MPMNDTIHTAIEHAFNSDITLNEFRRKVAAEKRKFQAVCQLWFDYMCGTYNNKHLRGVVREFMKPFGLETAVRDDLKAAELEAVFQTGTSLIYDTHWEGGQTDTLDQLQKHMLLSVATRAETKADRRKAAEAALAKLPEPTVPPLVGIIAQITEHVLEGH